MAHAWLGFGQERRLTVVNVTEEWFDMAQAAQPQNFAFPCTVQTKAGRSFR